MATPMGGTLAPGSRLCTSRRVPALAAAGGTARRALLPKQDARAPVDLPPTTGLDVTLDF